MNICSECKWHEYYHLDHGVQHNCMHEKSISYISPIHGGITRRDCYDMRKHSELCGSEGRLWEPIPDFFEKFSKLIGKLF